MPCAIRLCCSAAEAARGHGVLLPTRRHGKCSARCATADGGAPSTEELPAPDKKSVLERWSLILGQVK